MYIIHKGSTHRRKFADLIGPLIKAPKFDILLTPKKQKKNKIKKEIYNIEAARGGNDTLRAPFMIYASIYSFKGIYIYATSRELIFGVALSARIW